MKRKVDIWIESTPNSGNYSKIELFNDEEIQVSSSIQNIQDISKIFTDFSQSFTVPSSPVNNAIFEHFYNNDVDTVLDHNLRRNAYIEIDLTPFRTGRIQLEKASVKNNQNDHYSLTFYGEALSLKDKFGQIKLKDLDYSLIDSAYSGSEVQDRITDTTDYEVRYPLISSERLWSYGDATSTDISTTAGKINYTELFPAVKIDSIFTAIENYFSIDFAGLFQANTRWTNCFLYCKNKETFEVLTPFQTVDIITSDTHLDSIAGFNIIDSTNNLINFRYWEEFSVFLFGTQSLELVISSCSNLSATYYIDVVENGIVVNTITGSGNATYNIISYNTTSGLNNQVYCKIRSNQTVSLTFNYNYVKEETYKEYDSDDAMWHNYTETSIAYGIGTAQTFNTTSVDLASLMPDITVYDFVSGIFKNFNLTCYPQSTTIFRVEPLEDWYNKGIIRDITQYTTTEEIEVARVPLYKSIKFEHEQSQSFMNREFFDLFGREYGDLNNTFDYDGGDYLIKVPFENLLHSEFDGTMTQVGYCLTKAPDFKPYIPKPILLYMYEQQSTSIKFYDGVSTNTLTTYMPFGQDMKQNSTNYSLNWGADNSSLLNVPITQGKYATYYYGYLSNLFNKKNRLTTVKTILPLRILNQLKLNDRLVIRDKRYIINQMNSKLTTGEVTLELINDFRPIKGSSVTYVGKPTITLNSAILFPNLAKSATITTVASGVTITPSTITSEQEVSVYIPTYTNEYFNRITEDGNTRVDETFSNRITEQGYDNVITLDIEYTFEDGSTDTYQNYIIQRQ